MARHLKPIPSSPSSRVDPEDDRPALGSWWWVTATDTAATDLDRDRQWLGCIIQVGSNFVEIEGVRNQERIALDAMAARCDAELEPGTFFDFKIAEHKGAVRRLMGEIQRVCHQLGVPLHRAMAAADQPSTALALAHGVADVRGYKDALVVARDETLPELFKQVKEQHELMATWMKAELIPATAELSRARAITEAIEGKIHTVELYAGLQEELIQCRDGAPAEASEKVHVMQRRCYMDEECLARYAAGGMDFQDIEAFDAWIARDDNMLRILPHPRCIVAFRVRRHSKQYGGERDTLANFIRFWSYNEENMRTYLYVRNGRQLWRMATFVEFDEELFPRREASALLGDDEIWVHPQEIDGSLGFITGRTRAGMIDYWKMKRRALARMLRQWRRAGKPEEDWTYCVESEDDAEVHYSSWVVGSKHVQHGRPQSWRFAIDHPAWAKYELITPESIYHDDAMKRVAKAALEHNRIAVIVQGLLDRSTCLHPHPPWKIWTAEGFAAGIELVYDVTLAVTPGAAPSWEGYRAQLNKSLRRGCFAIGQRAEWRAEVEKKYGESWRVKEIAGTGPDMIDQVHAVKRDGQCQFKFTRARRRAKWIDDADKPGWIKAEYPEIPMAWWCSSEPLTCIDAYTPGDFHIFFDDPRTRADYLEWAPILLAAEDWHHARKQASRLTEDDWRQVFQLRCRSKQGKSLSKSERALVDAAATENPGRYDALETDVFNATVPFGSTVRRRSK